MSRTAARETLLGAVDTHPDFAEISHETYMDAWDGATPVYDLLCETEDAGGYRAFINPIDESGEFVASVSGGLSETTLSVQYRITPATDIETSLEAFEQGGFDHFTPAPPRPGETPFQTVFEAIEEAAREDSGEPTADRTLFDGSFQCRRCGTVHQVGTFAGAATPPTQITTDCPGCGGHRRSDGVPPAADAVLHRWSVDFEDIADDPYRVELTAPSRQDARTQAASAHPDRTIEFVHHEERR